MVGQVVDDVAPGDFVVLVTADFVTRKTRRLFSQKTILELRRALKLLSCKSAAPEVDGDEIRANPNRVKDSSLSVCHPPAISHPSSPGLAEADCLPRDKTGTKYFTMHR